MLFQSVLSIRNRSLKHYCYTETHLHRTWEYLQPSCCSAATSLIIFRTRYNFEENGPSSQTHAKRHTPAVSITPPRKSETTYQHYRSVIRLLTGNHSSRWDKTGLVVEALPHRHYRVRIDGSRRLTLRNRRFIRKISDECVKSTMDEIPDVRPTLTKEDDYRWNNKQSLEQQKAQVPQHPPTPESVEQQLQLLNQLLHHNYDAQYVNESCHQSFKILFYFELGFILFTLKKKDRKRRVYIPFMLSDS